MDNPVPPVTPSERPCLDRYEAALQFCEKYFVHLDAADDGRWCARVYSSGLNLEIVNGDGEGQWLSFLEAIEGLEAMVQEPPLGEID